MTSRIVIIGAGSAMFSLSLIRDLCLTPRLAGSSVVFVDVDAQRLAGAHELCRRYAAELGVTLMLEQTTDRRAALRGADFVVNTALVAGHRALRDGWAIARRHGYRMGGSLHVVHDEAFWVNFFQFALFDAIAGDATLFIRRDEVEAAWQIADAVRAGWAGRSLSERAGTRSRSSISRVPATSAWTSRRSPVLFVMLAEITAVSPTTKKRGA